LLIHYILATLCRRSVINNKKPLWLRAPRECSETDYSEFYKQTFNAYDEPAAHAHFSVEGNVDFKVRAGLLSAIAMLFLFLHLSLCLAVVLNRR
jgi:Hsp90 protein